MVNKTPHKHAELIKAWADGAEIQLNVSPKSGWKDTHQPSWRPSYEYRIKPEPKPDVVLFAWAVLTSYHQLSNQPFGMMRKDPLPADNVKFTFDGETGVLKSVEMIK